MRRLQLPPLSLYIHIPWCVRKCPYCDFNSHQAETPLPEQTYATTLLQDLDQELDLVQGRELHSVFLGGGTPSLFSGSTIRRILAGVQSRIPLKTDAEVTLEANPGTAEAEKFHEFVEAGINRISLGVQSFNDHQLEALGEIRAFRKETSKPVIAVLMDVAASGGYYIACACDEIVAHPSTITGSIGVIMQSFDIGGTLAKLGVTTDAITSGPNKDAGSPFRAMTPDERELFQKIIDEMYERFVQVVVEGRPKLDEATVRRIADGRVYTATQAVELGLVDRLATMREVIGSTKKRIGADKVRVVAYHRPLGYKPNYYAHAPAPGSFDINLIRIDLPDWLGSATPKFMYLWQPGSH